MTDLHDSPWEAWLQKWFLWLLVPAIVVNAAGLYGAILEPDGALYATIAKTIAQTGDFVNLRVDGKDWLDKPHFPFWMAALSFRLFGIHAFAYKLPAFLFWGMGAWYTYRLSLALYGKPVARLSILIYVSAAHLVISNNDVRAEPYLTGLVIGAVFHYYRAFITSSNGTRKGDLILGSLFAALAVMTKGPFVLFTIGAGFFVDRIARRKSIRLPNLIAPGIALLLVMIFILPELYCLYTQFDVHPDKIVFGHTGQSGIRFFFWDSQFGRFFNTGPIRGSGDPLFYFHTVLWAFLPWSILLYAAVWQKSRDFFSGKSLSTKPGSIPGDFLCLGAALCSFILFSLSRFQLPHYLNILFPFFCILTAAYCNAIRRSGTRQRVRIVQNVVAILLPLLVLCLTWFFRLNGWPTILAAVLILSVLPFVFFRAPALPVAFLRSFWAALLVYAFINFFFYPALLRYEAGTQAGRFADTWLSVLPAGYSQPSMAFTLDEAYPAYAFEFSCPLPVGRITIDSLQTRVKTEAILLWAPSAYSDSLRQRGLMVYDLQRFPNFHISQLTRDFLDSRSRESELESYSLFWVSVASPKVIAGRL